MRYLSVCSGIEAATVAWHPLGWTPVGFSEIDKFASAVLAERFGSNLPGEPLTQNGVPNFGDFTAIDLAQLGPVDLLVGGTPCQAFSFAGKRLSLADARGNLTLAYAVLAHELARSHGLRNALWENVPGVLSTEDNAFGCFLGALVGADDAVPLPPGAERWPDAGMVAGPRARAAWRLLDAQYFGLAQRRERVFVVVDFGNGADPAAVLFEPQGLQGNTPPRREAGERPAPTLSARTKGGGGLGTDFDLDGGLIADAGAAYGGGNRSGPIDVAATITAKGNRQDFEVETFVTEPFAFKASHYTRDKDGAPSEIAPPLSADADRGDQDTLIFAPERAATLTRGAESHGKGGYAGRRQEDDVNLVAFAIQAGALRENPDSGPDGVGVQQDHAYTLEARAEVQAVAYDTTQITSKANRSNPRPGDPCHPLAATAHPPALVQGCAVRRLTTTECARLQGFPDNHSRIPWRGKSAEDCPDGPQYKTYGNSMAVKAMRWLGERFNSSVKPL